MVDTQRFHLGPHAVQAVGAIATAIGSGRATNALEIATYVPLDVESIARILDSLEDEEILVAEQIEDGFKQIELVDATEYQAQAKLVHSNQHLDDPNFVRNLVALRADADWCRKVRDQHRVLRAIATVGSHTNLDRLSEAADVPPSRVRTVLGDLEAEGYAKTSTEDHQLLVEMPELEYPPDRFSRNEQLLSHVETRAAPIHRFWWVVLGVAAVLLILFIATRLAGP